MATTTTTLPGKRPATYDRLKKKKPVEETVEILLDDSPTIALTEARDKLLEAEGTLHEDEKNPKLKKARDEAKRALDAAMAAQDAEIVTIKFRAIGRKRFDALLDEHPPTKEQEQKAKDAGGEAGWNSDTFPPAVIAASAIEPELTIEQVMELYDDWNASEIQLLFLAAYKVNTNRRVPDLGNGYGGIQF